MPVDFTKTGELVRKLITAAREGTLEYTHRPPAKVDWGLYDLAQTREIADTLEFTRHLVDAAELRILSGRAAAPEGGGGRPPPPPTSPRCC
ncbi:MAG: hypothetical protein ACYCPN_05760 [Thermoplasmata archaeon]